MRGEEGSQGDPTEALAWSVGAGWSSENPSSMGRYGTEGGDTVLVALKPSVGGGEQRQGAMACESHGEN